MQHPTIRTSGRGLALRLGSAALLASLAIAGSAARASADACLADAAGNSSLNCTANDLGVASVTVTQVLDDGCAFDGDTFTFNGFINVDSSNATRYDLGVYIGEDSVQAYTGTCSVALVPPADPVNPGDPDTQLDGDSCGDVPSKTPLSAPVSNVTAVCRDADGDGFYDLFICASYDNNSQNNCNGTAQLIPGTGAKCQCTAVKTDLTVPNCNDDPTLCVDDGNPCTDTVCNPKGSGLGDSHGCSNDPNTASCDDGLFCNGADTCSGGTCSQHAGDPCTGAGPCSVCSEANDNCNAAAGTPCRAANGVCDVAETCTGTSTTCPANGFQDGTTCRAANGVCDTPETCSGTSANCPADGFLSGNTCRGSNGVCDVAETCSGTSPNCPADGFQSGGTCRASAGECDVAETCPGNNANCPADGFQSNGTACTTDGNVCTDDVCDGSGSCVHNDNSAACDDGAFCTVNDVCSGGACGGSPRDCSDGIACTDDSCDEGADSCVNAENNANCDDQDACTQDTCSVQQGGCVSDYVCGQDLCRSPGFWATHSGYEKTPKSINVGQTLLDIVGPLEVCGQSISATANGSAPWLDGLGLSSDLEGLCMRTKGVHQRQLYRQLVAAALNCAASGTANNCDTTVTKYLTVKFSDCSDLCAGLTPANPVTVGQCVGQLDCFNNGGHIVAGKCAFGTCADQPEISCGGESGGCPDFNSQPQECVPFEGNCHSAVLCNESLGFCPKGGPASSPGACKEARFNSCTIDSCN